MADMRLIDADAGVDVLQRKAKNYSTIGMHEAAEDFGSIARMLGNPVCFPTVEAEPVVHARWVHEQRYGDSGGWVWRCTACRGESISPIISAMRYCRSCGARMDAQEVEE